MNATLTTLFILGIAAFHPAQPPAETLNRLSTSAGEELARSNAELARLRDQIAGEKLPLAQELTELEQKVVSLRREHDQVTRRKDEGNLALPGLRTEIKARLDELAYIGNLLDEYARTFESKIGVGELQVVGEALESAKQAPENTTLSMAERFDRQVAFAGASLKRLGDVIGGAKFPGTAVDLEGGVAEGHFAVVGPVSLFRSAAGPAGLVVPNTGSTRPLVRPLEGPAQEGIGSLVEGGEGKLPLDPSRGGALKALIQKTNLFHIFEKGGPIMWPLLVASILALATVLERLVFLSVARRRRNPRVQERLFAELEMGDVRAAIEVGKTVKDFVVRTLVYALEHREKSLSGAILYAQAQELKRFRRGIPVLDTVITLAPLLGLLGTVTGMMGSFSLIGGELSAPGAITGGIAEALIATAFGLGIAITALLPFNFLNARIEDAQHEIESAAKQLELLLHPQPPVPAAAAA